MSTHNPAFLWETEALRDRRDRPDTSTPLSPGWVTLRRAHETTKVPMDTLRKWGKQGSIPSMVVESDDGPRRLVRLESVVARARSQGRDLPAMANLVEEPAPAAVGAQVADEPAGVAAGAIDTAPPPDAPAGTMIVPIAAWDKMLMQLGNLHEAGQQLAEARERAAKAETEATFLRERLSEFRIEHRREREDDSEPQAAPAQDTTGTQATGGAHDATPTPSPQGGTVWHYAVRRWKQRRQR